MATMATEVGVREFRGNLSAYLTRAQRGERFVVMSRGKPIAELGEVRDAVRDPRKPGALKGKIWIAEDFDEMDEDLLDIMENGPIFP
ncbi:type II toxin-antitoxin system prevent-host-death family antitoxin [Sphingomonas gilva]|uniref:Type II toxin-antitoxin system prevent-host-death family antitoxin n=1 Tax=Sphingomonas gilva TaxID=2305907 RepID=A0A396RW64_9SPHN|nr:type II toxin-antitoxin system prevent-host-death family antitoxin [Sphingomonas gilva]RHW17921.1 type II toxin-antitoxin system prevent-host-death family antitoxin [Sphingomonas gilva]